MRKITTISENYNNIRTGIVELLKAARSATARNVNSIMTAAYWDIGRRIVGRGTGKIAHHAGPLLDDLLLPLVLSVF